MEAKNYRIGNYIQYNNENKSIGQITTLVSDYVSGLDYCQIDFVINKKHWLINVHPVPLTEELLLNIGFKKDKYNMYSIEYYNKRDDINYTVEYEFNPCTKRLCSYETCIVGIGCEFLHELQNLHFTRTGEELEFKS